MAAAGLAGEDFLVGLGPAADRCRGPGTGVGPRPAFHHRVRDYQALHPENLADIEAGIGNINTTMMDLLPPVRRNSLFTGATIDALSVDIEQIHTRWDACYFAGGLARA